MMDFSPSTGHISTTPMFICDAFANGHFGGNQAAVCFVPSDLYLMEWSNVDSLEASLGRGEPEKETLTAEERQAKAEAYRKRRHSVCGAAFQRVAEEMNMSETAFVYRLPTNHVRRLQEQIKEKVKEYEGEYKERVVEDRRRSTMFGELDAVAMSDAAAGADAAAGSNNNNKPGAGAFATEISAGEFLSPHAPGARGASVEGGRGASFGRPPTGAQTSPKSGAAKTPDNEKALGSPFSPGLIPSSSFNDFRPGESMLATRSCSITSAGASFAMGSGGGIGGSRAGRPRRLHTQWFGIRWFTPRAEIALCGHATFAAAHALFESARLSHFAQSRQHVEGIPMEFFIPVQTDVICFAYEGGVISVRRREDNDTAFQRCRDNPNAVEEYEVHFPQNEAHSVMELVPPSFVEKVVAALGLPYGSEGVLDVATSEKNSYYVFRLADPRYVFQCRPDTIELMHAFEDEAFVAAQKQHPERLAPVVGLIVTAENNGDVVGPGAEADIISRFFAPWVGVPEDPVTGTAHCVIVPYWLKLRQAGEMIVGDKLRCYQASPRGGHLTAIIIGRQAHRIALIGSAVTFLRGTNAIKIDD